MANTYVWRVVGLRVQKVVVHNDVTYNDVVDNIMFEVDVTSPEGFMRTYSGGREVNFGDITPETFISYTDITEELALSWVQGVLGEFFTNDLDSWLSMLERQENKTMKPLPWA